MHEMYILSSLIPVLILLWIYVKNVWIDINEHVTTRLYIFLINLDKANIGNDLFFFKVYNTASDQCGICTSHV